MMQRFYAQLPDFARPDNPVMRYVMFQRAKTTTRRSQLVRIVLTSLVLIFTVLIGYLFATNFGKTALDNANPLDQVFLVLYAPLVFIQLIVSLIALGSTSSIIASEVQHGTWDTLKVTTNGAALTFKSRWAAVFYRVRFYLFILVIARLIFIGIVLSNLTAFQGRYLDLLLSGTTPLGLPGTSETVTLVAGILIMAMMMTAALLAPFTTVALNAGIGMLVGTFSGGRLLGTLGQGMLLIGQILIMGLALQVGAVALSLATPGAWPSAILANSPVLQWLAALFGISAGDMGLSTLNLDRVLRIWADRDYGVLVGVAFLGYTLLQAALANALVNWAARRAAKADEL
jgi:hypothetical protein